MRRAVAVLMAGIVVLLLATGAAAAPIETDATLDIIELAFDGDGVLHLVGHSAAGPLQHHLVERTRTADGSWSPAADLTAGFDIADAEFELLHHPDGRLCLFFNAWRVSTDGGTVGLYRRCLANGTWEAASEQLSPPSGVTASFDAAFTPAGETRFVAGLPTTTISSGGVQLWTRSEQAGWARLAIDGTGTLHAAWAAFTETFAVYTSRSTDDGRTWTAPESLTGDGQIGVPFDFLSDAAGDVHLLVPGNVALYRRWSGASWGPVEELPTETGPKRLAVGPDGQVSVAWGSFDGIYELHRAGEGTWTEPALVQSIVPFAIPTLAATFGADGELAIAWRDSSGLNAGGAAARPGGAEDPSFSDSVPSPFDISLDPAVLAQSAALAGGVLLLMPLPAQLFNSTLEANAAEIGGWTARLRRRLWRRSDRTDGFWRRPTGIAAFFVIAALISAFLDPTLALTIESGATIAGLLAGLVVVSVGFQLPRVLVHRSRGGAGARIEVLPVALPIALASVAISRLTSFEPGYLYGILAGVTLLGTVRPEDDVRGSILAGVWTLAVCLVAWVALVPVRAAAGETPPLLLVAVEAGLATIVTSGLEALVFGLLPLSIVPGGLLFRSSRRAWALLLGVSVFAFFHILVNPASGYLVDSSRVPLLTTVALLVGFSALTVLTWAFFRFRAGRVSAPAS